MKRISEDLFILEDMDRVALVAACMCYQNSMDADARRGQDPEERETAAADGRHVDRLITCLKGHFSEPPTPSIPRRVGA